MRLHFAAELILELVVQKLNLEKIGAHIAETKARIDFFCNQNISFLFEDLLRDYNALIEKNYIIKTGFTDVKNQRRFWEIEGFSKVACGGTHLEQHQKLVLFLLKESILGEEKSVLRLNF